MPADEYCSTIIEDYDATELNVTFFPPLYQQRRIWILNILRQENVTDVLDVGCGEGQLLAALSQPAPWLKPPPESVLPSSSTSEGTSSPIFTAEDTIPNLHPARIMGLDVSQSDLEFAIQYTSQSTIGDAIDRWEPMLAEIWYGGLESINEEFVDVDCIVSSEVIEHLSPEILPFFAPVLLGVYHPRLFLMTTPSYTFNARFTSPTALASVRQGYTDPTGRTDRVFRHHDHKFEWTRDEFHEWCMNTAEEWGYDVQMNEIGKSNERDEWGRDEELGGASFVAEFRRKEAMPDREQRARTLVQNMGTSPLHHLLSTSEHVPHPQAQNPVPLSEIGSKVKEIMETEYVGFLMLEEIWFRENIAAMCGGWIELLARAVNECEGLTLKIGTTGRENWIVELVGGIAQPRMLWPSTEVAVGDRSFDSPDYMPPDWIPEEEAYAESSSGGEWDESAGAEGDISWDGSEDDNVTDSEWPDEMLHDKTALGHWKDGGWISDAGLDHFLACDHLPPKPSISSSSSTAGWDGDEDENSDDTTS